MAITGEERRKEGKENVKYLDYRLKVLELDEYSYLSDWKLQPLGAGSSVSVDAAASCWRNCKKLRGVTVLSRMLWSLARSGAAYVIGDGAQTGLINSASVFCGQKKATDQFLIRFGMTQKFGKNGFSKDARCLAQIPSWKKNVFHSHAKS